MWTESKGGEHLMEREPFFLTWKGHLRPFRWWKLRKWAFSISRLVVRTFAGRMLMEMFFLLNLFDEFWIKLRSAGQFVDQNLFLVQLADNAQVRRQRTAGRTRTESGRSVSRLCIQLQTQLLGRRSGRRATGTNQSVHQNRLIGMFTFGFGHDFDLRQTDFLAFLLWFRFVSHFVFLSVLAMLKKKRKSIN